MIIMSVLAVDLPLTGEAFPAPCSRDKHLRRLRSCHNFIYYIQQLDISSLSACPLFILQPVVPKPL